MKLKEFKKLANKYRLEFEKDIKRGYRDGVCLYICYIAQDLENRFSEEFRPRTLSRSSRTKGIDGDPTFWLGVLDERNDDVRRTFFDMFIEVSIIEKWYKEY